MNTKKFSVLLFIVLVTVASNSFALTQYIGDADGFGFGAALGLVNVNGDPADMNGNGILDAGDAMPDLNKNGKLATGQGDDFDNRSTAEAADAYAQWTDVSLSTSFDDRPGLAKDASFVFTFTVPDPTDVYYGKDHYINLVYGDYDVDPMEAVVEGTVVALIDNSVAGNVNGTISQAYAVVSWADMEDGEVVIEIEAPDGTGTEPYVTFDYALLSTEPLPIPSTIPEPATMVSILVGVVAAILRKRKA